MLRELVIARGPAPPVFKAAAGALKDIALLLGHRIERMLALAGRGVGADGLAAAPPQPRPEGIPVGGGSGQAALRSQPSDQGRCDGSSAWVARADEQAARWLTGRIAMLELSPSVLARALDAFPSPGAPRPLDALHLASCAYLAEHGQGVALASYDQRMNAVARAMDIPLFELEAPQPA